MKKLKPILFIVAVNLCFAVSLIAQSEQGYLLGMKDFEKSFTSENTDWDSNDNLYLDSHLSGHLTSNKLGLKTKDIIGKEMIYKYGNFDIQLVITSDSTLYVKNNQTGNDANEKMSTIQIDKHTMLASFVDTENNLITMFSDFEYGKISAFLYKEDGSVISVSGSIKLKK